MNRFFSIVFLLFVTTVNLAVIALIAFSAYVSYARIEWMTEHEMTKHEIAYCVLGVLVLVAGFVALLEGWKMTKHAYRLFKYEEL
jgi:branched-subunit amino acid ABC-type transport system permease component